MTGGLGRRVVPSLLAKDLAETARFYEEVLGFELEGCYPDPESPTWIELRRDGVVLQFFSEPPRGMFDTPCMSGTLYVYPDSVSALARELEGRVPFVWGPQAMPYGLFEFAIADPSGYLIAFAEPADDSDAPSSADSGVELRRLDPQPTLVMRLLVAPKDLGARLGEALPAILSHARERGLEVAGHPFVRYMDHDEDEGVFDIEAGLPLTEAAPSEGPIRASDLPGGEVATLLHRGPYHDLGSAHEALGAGVRALGRTPAGPAWDVYVTDPACEPDPSRWETRLFVPLGG